jgi:monovalent cation:H+ antiporter, CPA1 family
MVRAPMNLYTTVAILITLTAVFSYLNYRYLLLHPSVGVMVLALGSSLALLAAGSWGLGVKHLAERFLQHISFDKALLQWMLGFLLFAGGLSVDLNELLHQRWITALLSIAATVLSMFIVGFLVWFAVRVIHINLPLPYCLLFGALISPTDPVAVVSLMRTVGAPKDLQTIISAESLFNDGIGVVLFLTMLAVITGTGPATSLSVIGLFARQSIGGALLGFASGGFVYLFLRRVHAYQVAVILTLALVMGGYALAELLRVSGPIAAVVAGVMIGNRGRVLNVPSATHDDLEKFWEVIEEVLNAVLFVLIGLEVLVLPYTARHLVAALAAVPIVLLARWISVAVTISTLPRRGGVRRAMIPILTWGGLRGGLAIAMALSLEASNFRDIIVAITYGVVLFSIIVQGTTVHLLVKRYVGVNNTNVASPALTD